MSDTDVIATEAAGRYATALLDLSKETKSLKTVEKDVKALKKLFASSETIQAMASNPVFKIEDKVKAIMALCKSAKIGKTVSNFAGMAAQNRRAAEIPAMLKAFQEQLAKERGASKAVVTSASKLSAAQLASLKTNLKKSLGKSVDIETNIDPDLLGGFVVQIGSRLFDSSLKTKLEGIKLAMKEV